MQLTRHTRGHGFAAPGARLGTRAFGTTGVTRRGLAAGAATLLLSSLLLASLGGARRSSGSERATPSQVRVETDSTYRVHRDRGGFATSNAAQGLAVLFRPSGVLIASGKMRLGLSLRAAGYGRLLTPVDGMSEHAYGSRLLHARKGLDEWYLNSSLGLEQGFNIPRALSGRGGGPLTLEFAISSNAAIVLTDGARELLLLRRGSPALRYSSLSAVDARGRALRGWFELHPGKLLLRIDSRGAHYPLRLDPLLQQAQLEGGLGFGRSVALSADGNAALVAGAPDFGLSAGASFLTRADTSWTQQPVEPGGPWESDFQLNVGLSGNGATAVIGDSQYGSGAGAAWLLTRSGSTWTTGEKFSVAASAGEEGKDFGETVALAPEGNVALVGAPFDNGGRGGAWILAPPSPPIPLELPKAVTCGGRFGAGVSLSSNGNRAVVACPLSNSIFEFIRLGASNWAYFDKVQVEFSEGSIGGSVALSEDGNKLLVGGFSVANFTAPLGWVFTRAPTTANPVEWSAQPELLPSLEPSMCHNCPADPVSSVALSPDGNSAAIGAADADAGVGAAWSFRWSGAGWTGGAAKLVGNEPGRDFGASMALAADGDTVLVGEAGQGLTVYPVGFAKVFVNPPPEVVTNGASNVSAATATLNAIVNPNERTTSDYFRYGASEAYDQSTPAQSAGAGTAAGAVSTELSGLAPATTYHYRVFASSSAGTSHGSDQTFTTLSLPPAPAAPASTAPPVLSGPPIRGSAVSVSQGSWSNHPTSFAYQWQSCDANGGNCANLSGATSATHVVSQADVGRKLRAVVTASNAAGSSSAISSESAIAGSYVEATMTWEFGWTRRFTIVQSLIVHAVPPGGRVEVVCTGRGCPFAHARAASAHVRRHCRKRKCKSHHPKRSPSEVVLTPLFKRSRLKPGAHIGVRVVKPSWIEKSYVFVMRSNATPRVQITAGGEG